MQRKLTLSIDEQTIEFIRDYSKKTHKSISGLVEDYFRYLQKINDKLEISEKTMSLYGIFSDNIIPDKHQLRDILYAKSDG